MGGYLALFLLDAAYVSIGVYASSITDNQIVAFLVALTINTCLHLLLPFIAGSFTGWRAACWSSWAPTALPEHGARRAWTAGTCSTS